MYFKKFLTITLAAAIMISFVGCHQETQEDRDREVVQEQQSHYGKVQPLPFYDYSIPRDIMIQIYNVVTQDARSTYTVIESITGQTKFHGPSIGYGIPADVSLTNPLQPAFASSDRTDVGTYNDGEVIEQAEPNGLFSSKNTDGTWVLFVDVNGDLTPIYTEHKITTFPFAVEPDGNGGWVRAGQEEATMVVDIK